MTFGETQPPGRHISGADDRKTMIRVNGRYMFAIGNLPYTSERDRGPGRVVQQPSESSMPTLLYPFTELPLFHDKGVDAAGINVEVVGDGPLNVQPWEADFDCGKLVPWQVPLVRPDPLRSSAVVSHQRF